MVIETKAGLQVCRFNRKQGLHQSGSQHRSLVCEAVYNLGFGLKIRSSILRLPGGYGRSGDRILRYSQVPTPKLTASTLTNS